MASTRTPALDNSGYGLQRFWYSGEKKHYWGKCGESAREKVPPALKGHHVQQASSLTPPEEASCYKADLGNKNENGPWQLAISEAASGRMAGRRLTEIVNRPGKSMNEWR